MTTDRHNLGFEEYPEPVGTMLEAYDWDEPLNKQRMGVILTFATAVPYHGGAQRFYVDELSTGHNVYLQHPGQLNNGFDYQVRVDGWDDTATQRPSHDEIYSDFAHKREYASEEAFNALCRAAFDIHEGAGANEVIDRYGDKFDFAEGRIPEALLRPLPWLFIEQDIRYWHGEGRDMTIGTIRSLCDGGSTDQIDDLQSLEEINETELAIKKGD